MNKFVRFVRLIQGIVLVFGFDRNVVQYSLHRLTLSMTVHVSMSCAIIQAILKTRLRLSPKSKNFVL